MKTIPPANNFLFLLWESIKATQRNSPGLGNSLAVPAEPEDLGLSPWWGEKSIKNRALSHQSPLASREVLLRLIAGEFITPTLTTNPKAEDTLLGSFLSGSLSFFFLKLVIFVCLSVWSFVSQTCTIPLGILSPTGLFGHFFLTFRQQL